MGQGLRTGKLLALTRRVLGGHRVRRLLVLFLLVSPILAGPAVRFEPVPHFTRGRHGQKIDMVVIHTVEGSLASCLATFRGEREVSAHYVVGKDGSIVQCVNDEDEAWHAGSVNGRSIGIEHEGFAFRASTWNDANMRASARLTRWLCDKHGIPIDRAHIVGHVEVPHSGHDDPGPYFDWDLYLRLVRGDVAPSDSSGSMDEPLPLPRAGRPVSGDAPAAPPSLSQRGNGNPAPKEPEPTAQRRTVLRDPTSRGIAGALDARPLLERGSTGPAVRELQERLSAGLDEDGLFGPKTEAAVRAFQQTHGCEVDGIVGTETWRALGG
jgi:N-acetyl-anhydromuramyl-L-alanine amidase AmpD